MANLSAYIISTKDLHQRFYGRYKTPISLNFSNYNVEGNKASWPNRDTLQCIFYNQL